jgi:hypothetical protein
VQKFKKQLRRQRDKHAFSTGKQLLYGKKGKGQVITGHEGP